MTYSNEVDQHEALRQQAILDAFQEFASGGHCSAMRGIPRRLANPDTEIGRKRARVIARQIREKGREPEADWPVEGIIVHDAGYYDENEVGGLTDSHLESLLQLAELSSLVVSSRHFTAAGIRFLVQHPNLSDLTLGLGQLDSSIVSAINDYQHTMTLRLVGVGMDSIHHVADIERLRTLEMDNWTESDDLQDQVVAMTRSKCGGLGFSNRVKQVAVS